MNAAINDRLEQSFREDARWRDLREALALALGADVAAVTLHDRISYSRCREVARSRAENKSVFGCFHL